MVTTSCGFVRGDGAARSGKPSPHMEVAIGRLAGARMCFLSCSPFCELGSQDTTLHENGGCEIDTIIERIEIHLVWGKAQVPT